MIYPNDFINKIVCGNCLDILKSIPSNSIDSIVTDPPYGISFMNKHWDINVPSVEIWKECLRTLKVGSFAFIMSSPRQDVLSEMIVRIRQAGFDTNFTSLYWVYASGFPKAMNISKMVDKRNGRLPEQYKELGEYLKEKRGNRPQKEIAVFFPSITNGLTGCVSNWELGSNVPTKEQYTILKKKLNLDDRFDELIEREEAEREVIGKDKDRGKDTRSIFNMGIGQWNITLSSTPEAKQLDGSYAGFQPKPALECIIVAMKPLSEKAFVDQALKNGKGITWLDDTRIPILDNDRHEYGISGDECHPTVNCYGDHDRVEYTQNKDGRFPANLLVSDDILNDGFTHSSCQSSELHGEYGDNFKFGGGISSPNNQYCDSGSFSRYFSLDAWFTKTIKNLPPEIQKTFPFLINTKASKSERNKGCDKIELVYNDDSRHDKDAIGCNNPRNRSGTPKSNHHPTVKPTKLFSYLVTLGSRQHDIILDPFIGSGTLGISCQLLSRKFIGIEINPEYCEIANARLFPYLNQNKIKKISIESIKLEEI